MEGQFRQAHASVRIGARDEKEIGRKVRMDCRVDWGLHLGPYPGCHILSSARIWTGHCGGSVDHGRCCFSAILCAMAASFNALLEAHACTLWSVFHRYRLGSMVVRQAGGSWTQLAESALARACAEPVRTFKQQKVGIIRCRTRYSTGRRFRYDPSPPASYLLGSRTTRTRL